MSYLSDLMESIGSDLVIDQAGTTGTYTPLSGSTLTNTPTIEQNAVRSDRRSTMDVLLPSDILAAGQQGATYTANDGRVWEVVGWENVPGVTILKVETSVGTGTTP